MRSAGLQHSVPGPGPVQQLRGLGGPGGEDPERRQRVGQLPDPGLPELPEEADDRLSGRRRFSPGGSETPGRLGGSNHKTFRSSFLFTVAFLLLLA